MMMIMIMMMNCFCGMVDQRKALNLISKWNHYQRSSPSRISDMPRAGFQPTQSLSSGLVEWSCPVVITTTPRRHSPQANPSFHSSEVGEWQPDDTGAKSGSSAMRFAPIDHRWWYNRGLRIYDLESLTQCLFRTMQIATLRNIPSTISERWIFVQ